MNISKKIRNGFIFIFLLCLSFGTTWSQVPDKSKLEYPQAEQNMKTVKEAMKAYESGNWEMLRENVTEDVFFYNLGSFDSLNLKETIEYWKKGRETATPALSEDQIWLPVSVSEGPREGNWVLHWGANTLTYPDGQTISFPYHIATKLDNNKIAKIYFYYDNSRILRALGYSIDPPLKEEEDQNDSGINQNEW